MFMYRLMISFKRDGSDKYGIASQPQDFFVRSSDEVCEIISKLSHLKPVITLCQQDILTLDEVLKRFEKQNVI